MCLTSLNEVISLILLLLFLLLLLLLLSFLLLSSIILLSWLQSVTKRLETPTYLFGQNGLSDIVELKLLLPIRFQDCIQPLK